MRLVRHLDRRRCRTEVASDRTRPAGRRGRSGWRCRWPGKSSRTWPSSTAPASARSSCAAPTWTPARQTPCSSPAGTPWRHVCPSCAERARTLRAAQCREGWHLEDEPDHRPRTRPPRTRSAGSRSAPRPSSSATRPRAAGQDTTDLDELIARAGRGDHQGRDAREGRPGPPGAAAPLDPAPPGRPGPAPPQGQPAHGGQDLHRAGRQDLPPVPVRHPDLPVLRPGRRGRAPGRPGRLRL